MAVVGGQRQLLRLIAGQLRNDVQTGPKTAVPE